MTVIDPNTGLLITCEPWEYAELCKQRGWIKTTYVTNTTPIKKYDFTTSTVPLSDKDKAIADKAVELIVRDYGEVIKRLGEE